MIRDEKIADIDVTGALPARGFTVALHLDGAFIVLVKNCLLDWIALSFHEQFDVQCVRQVITRPDELSLGGALGVYFLFLGFAENPSATERDDTPSVSAHVIVDGERCVDPGHEVVE